MLDYSIVIPAYNEADKITSTLTQILSFMRSFSPAFEVVVVDDGSSDDTADVVEKYMKNNPEIILIKNPHAGKGAAVRTGMLEAHGDYVFMCDADLSMPITELKKLSVWAKDQNFDIVIASREGTGAKRIDEPLIRHIMGRIFNMIVQMFALPGINDSQCGFKLFKKQAAQDAFSNLIVYGPNRKEKKPFFGAFDVEVLFLAKKFGYTIKEVPITWTYVKTTRLSHVKDSIKMAFDVMRIRFTDVQGKYSKNKISALA